MYSDIMREILSEYERKRDWQEKDKQRRIQEVYKKIPAIEKIDEDILKIGIGMSRHIIGNPKGYLEVVKKAKEKIEALKMEKAYLLTECNIPPDYMDIRYFCNHCEDSGYLANGEKCHCLKQALVSRAYKMSNLENILEKENFKTFNINIFSDKPFEGEGMTPRENMKDINGIADGFISNFDENNGENLLFYGTDRKSVV